MEYAANRGSVLQSSGSINTAYFGCFSHKAGGQREGNCGQNCRAPLFMGCFFPFTVPVPAGLIHMAGAVAGGGGSVCDTH